MSKKKAKPLTPAEYAEKKGTCCPFCGSTDFEGQEVNIEEGKAYQEIDCMSCNASWVDTYILTGYYQS